MQTKIKSARFSRQSVSRDPYRAILYYDRITLWLSLPELAIPLELIKQHCTDAKCSVKKMTFNARWKARLEILQPTKMCLRLLAKALGSEISAMPIYVEFACDLLASCEERAQRWSNDFVASAQIKHHRPTVIRSDTTWYAGSRHKQNGKRRKKVLAVYCDKPSKLNNARPDPLQPPDFHVELRIFSSTALSKLGICCLNDLLQFDHYEYWDRHVRMYQLPSQRTELGMLLAKASGADTDVSGTALRKRAARWIAKHSVDGNFVMHSALRRTPHVARFLRSIRFSQWLEAITSTSHD